MPPLRVTVDGMHTFEIARIGLLALLVTIAGIVGFAYVHRPAPPTVVLLQAAPAAPTVVSQPPIVIPAWNCVYWDRRHPWQATRVPYCLD